MTEEQETNTEIYEETPSQSLMEEGAIPKRCWPGCGCLVLIVLYYLPAFFIWKDLQGENNGFARFAYLLGPILWPAMLGGWVPGQIPGCAVALVGLVTYAVLVWRLLRATTRRNRWRYLLWIFLLFLLSFGGCVVGFDRSFKTSF
jgi:hypothetical protein